MKIPLLLAALALLAGCEAQRVPTPTFEPSTPTHVAPTFGGSAPTITWPTTAPAPEGTPATVERVVDGDTVHLLVDGERVTVRVIGIDTPETVHPSRPVECGGPEATAFARGVLTGPVEFHQDPTQDQVDHFGRTLAYIELADGRDYGEAAIRGGYAEYYIYRVPPARGQVYAEAEDEARQEGRGIWGAC